jgi:glucose/arabinose dehydrogenase
MKKIIVLSLVLIFARPLFSEAYIYETVIDSLAQPIEFSFIQNNNIIITQKGGRAVVYNMNGQFVSTFWNFTDSTTAGGERGLLGMCLDPNYPVNHYVYFYYTHSVPAGIRVVRLTENNNVGTNPQNIFTYIHSGTFNGIHVGGIIRINNANRMYILIGNNGLVTSQSLTTPLGKILRINSNGTIPTDNPFYDDGNPATGNDDRIWAYGVRNGFGLCISPYNDSLFETENGDNWKDELNFIRKGKNYGYPTCQGNCEPYNPLFQQPATVFDCCPPMFPSAVVTGVIVYTGSQMPELNGKLIVSGMSGLPNGGLYVCTLNPPLYDSVISKQVVTNSAGIVSLQQGADGYIYASQIGSGSNGFIYRIKHDLTGIHNNGNPVGFSLSQNYPNPFNPTTSIKYEIPKNEFVILKIFNVLGIEVATLLNETKQQGSYGVSWDAANFPSGVYFYELQAGDFKERKKMVLIK